MRKAVRSLIALLPAFVPFATAPLPSQTPRPQPLTMPLDCKEGDCPLLEGAPQTAGMRSGFVRLKPGATVGWHTTGQNEETLVILHGQGAALIEGQPARNFAAPAIAYIPPGARHNVQNTGHEPWNTSTWSLRQ